MKTDEVRKRYKVYFTVNGIEDYFIFEETQSMDDVRGEVMHQIDNRGLDVIKNNIRSEQL